VDAVRMMRKLLDTLELSCFLKTTGGKGLHVVVPIEPTLTWDDAKSFTKSIAELFARTFPDRFVSTVSKAKRTGRIFIDYLRNSEGATAIAPYGTRARRNAPVAMPIDWSELKQDVRFDFFTVQNVSQRLRRRRDAWSGYSAARQRVSDEMFEKVGSKTLLPRPER
jgi:bifunctional non-homologous end joining protein LigD